MTALITVIAFLDILDVLRVLPVLVEWLFLQKIFRHVFCSFGVFHELAVAIFLVSLSIAICVQVSVSLWTDIPDKIGTPGGRFYKFWPSDCRTQ